MLFKWRQVKNQNISDNEKKLIKSNKEVQNAASDLYDSVNEIKKIVQANVIEEFDRRIKNIIDVINDGVVIIDTSHKIIMANKNISNIFNFAVEDLIGEDLSILMTYVDAQNHHQYLQKYLTDVDIKKDLAKLIIGPRELNAKRKNGEIFPIDITITEIKRPDASLIFMASIRDITKRKEQEKILNQQKKFYHDILDSLPINIFLKDKDGKYIFANNSFSNFVNHKKNDIIGFKDNKFWDYETLEQLRKEDQAVTSRKLIFSDEKNMNNKDLIVVKKSVEINNDVFMLGFSIDVTEKNSHKKIIEEQTLKLNAIFDNSPHGLLLINDVGDVLESNKCFKTMLKVPEDTIIRNIIDFCGIDREIFFDLLNDAEEEDFSQKDFEIDDRIFRIYVTIIRNTDINFVLTIDEI